MVIAQWYTVRHTVHASFKSNVPQYTQLLSWTPMTSQFAIYISCIAIITCASNSERNIFGYSTISTCQYLLLQ